MAASLEVGPGSASAAGRKVVDVLDAWIDQNLDTSAPPSARDQQSRVRSIKQDKVAEISIAQFSIADVKRWHTRLRRDEMQDAGIRNQHGALSAALNQSVRWGWASQHVASLAQRKTSPILRPSAEVDLVERAEHYRDEGRADLAERFFDAAMAALDAIGRMPGAGSPSVGELCAIDGLPSPSFQKPCIPRLDDGIRSGVPSQPRMPCRGFSGNCHLSPDTARLHHASSR